MKNRNHLPISSKKNICNLEKLRRERGLTQENIAKIVGCTAKSFGLYEKQKQLPHIEVLINMANYFNVSTDYILGRSNCIGVSNEYISRSLGLNENSINALKQINSNPSYRSVITALNIVLDGNFDLLKNIFNYIVSDYMYYADKDGKPQNDLLPLLNRDLLEINRIDVNKLNGVLLQNITENIVELKNKYKESFSFQPVPLTNYLDMIINNNALINEYDDEIKNALNTSNLKLLETIVIAKNNVVSENSLLELLIIRNYSKILKSKDFENYSNEQRMILNTIYENHDFEIDNIL